MNGFVNRAFKVGEFGEFSEFSEFGSLTRNKERFKMCRSKMAKITEKITEMV